MKNNKDDKKRLRYGLWGLVALAATQMYFLRELFFAWLMFILVFCLVATVVFFLIAIFEAARATLGWVAPKLPAARPVSNARLARSH